MILRRELCTFGSTSAELQHNFPELWQCSRHTSCFVITEFAYFISLEHCCFLRILSMRTLDHRVDQVGKPALFGLPQRFTRIRVPICESCQLGKQTRTCTHIAHQRPIRGTIFLECVSHLSIYVFDPMLKLDALSSSGGNSRCSC